MLAVEQSRGDTFFGQQYQLEDYQTIDMEYYPQHYQQQQDESLWFASSENADVKPQMTRTTSSNSAYQHDFAPGLSASNGSIRSGSSSTVGSPYSGPSIEYSQEESYLYDTGVMTGMPAIVSQDAFAMDGTVDYSSEVPMPFEKLDGSVDPSLIGYPDQSGYANGYSHVSPMPSPAASPAFYNPQFTTQITHPGIYAPFPHSQMLRQPSQGSYYSSGMTHPSPQSEFEDGTNRLCRECGKSYKDIKAHMLTHQTERPEKCPITTCEYHKKGFARKYDKNRHTLTHYKGTMVCGFCPGSGTPSEKSFNRADVFKRHLCSVHQVEQAPPNSRKRSPSGSSNKKLSSYCADATGKCSTCKETFNNAQDFYEHLDECVMRVVQQEEPTEAINQKHMASVKANPELMATLERHSIKAEEESVDLELDEEEDEDDSDDEDESTSFTVRPAKKQGVVISGGIRKKGFTWSQGGVKPAVAKKKQRRSNYPPSWGMSPDKTTMKKRVMVCYDGPRRLVKDEMMLDRSNEVRLAYNDGQNYVTDLDIETMKRAEAFHGASEEERGPYVPEDDYSPPVDIDELMA